MPHATRRSACECRKSRSAEYRERAGLSQENLADAAELDRTFIGLLERGQRQPTLETLFRIANALKVAPQTLIARTAAEL
ncbi:MAG: helix-turn-helix domain-containing protein [Steroidobacter sp.]